MRFLSLTAVAFCRLSVKLIMQKIDHGASTSPFPPLPISSSSVQSFACPLLTPIRAGYGDRKEHCNSRRGDATGTHLSGIFAALDALQPQQREQQQPSSPSSSSPSEKAATSSTESSPSSPSSAAVRVVRTGSELPTQALYRLSDGAAAWMCTRLDALWEATAEGNASTRASRSIDVHDSARAAAEAATGAFVSFSGGVSDNTTQALLDGARVRSQLIVRLLALDVIGDVKRQQQQQRSTIMSTRDPMRRTAAREPQTVGLSALVRQWLWQHAAALPRLTDGSGTGAFSGDLSALLAEWAALEVKESREVQSLRDAAAELRRALLAGRRSDAVCAMKSTLEAVQTGDVEVKQEGRDISPLPLLVNEEGSDVPVTITTTSTAVVETSARIDESNGPSLSATPPASLANPQGFTLRVLRLGVGVTTTTAEPREVKSEQPPQSLSLASVAAGEAEKKEVTATATGTRRFAIQLFPRPPPPPLSTPLSPARGVVEAESAEAPPLCAVKLEAASEEGEEAAKKSEVEEKASNQTAVLEEATIMDAVSHTRWRRIAPFVFYVPRGSGTARDVRTVLAAFKFGSKHEGASHDLFSPLSVSTSAQVAAAPLCPWGRLPPLVAAYAWLRMPALRRQWLRHIFGPHSFPPHVAAPAATHAMGEAAPRVHFPCVAYADARLSAVLEALYAVPLSVSTATSSHSSDTHVAKQAVFCISPSFEREFYRYLCFPLAGVVVEHETLAGSEGGSGCGAGGGGGAAAALTHAEWEAYVCFRYGNTGGVTCSGVPKESTSMNDAAASVRDAPSSFVSSLAAAAVVRRHHRRHPSASPSVLYMGVMDLAAMLIWSELRRVCAKVVKERAGCLVRLLRPPASDEHDSGAGVPAAVEAAAAALSTALQRRFVVSAALHCVLEEVVETDEALTCYVQHMTNLSAEASISIDGYSSCCCKDLSGVALLSHEEISEAAYASTLWLSLVAVCSIGESAVAQYVRNILLPPPSSLAGTSFTTLSTTESVRIDTAAAATTLAPFTVPTLFRSSLEDLHREEAALRCRPSLPLCRPRRTNDTTTAAAAAAATKTASSSYKGDKEEEEDGEGGDVCTVAVVAAIALRHPRVLLRQVHLLWLLSGSSSSSSEGIVSSLIATQTQVDTDGAAAAAHADFVARVGTLVECFLLAANAGVPPPLAAAPVAAAAALRQTSHTTVDAAVSEAETRTHTSAPAQPPLVVSPPAPAPSRPRLQLRLSSSAVPLSCAAVAADASASATSASFKRDRDVSLTGKERADVARQQHNSAGTNCEEDSLSVLPALEGLVDLRVRWSDAAAEPHSTLLAVVADVLCRVQQHLHSCQMKRAPPSQTMAPIIPQPTAATTKVSLPLQDTEDSAADASLASARVAPQRPPLLLPRRTLMLRLPPAYAALQRLWPSLIPFSGSREASPIFLSPRTAVPGAAVLEVELPSSLSRVPTHVDVRRYASLAASLRAAVCVGLGYAVYALLQHVCTAFAAASDAARAGPWLEVELRVFYDDVLQPLHRICGEHVEAGAACWEGGTRGGTRSREGAAASWLSYRPLARVLFPQLIATVEAALAPHQTKGSSSSSSGSDDAAKEEARVVWRTVRTTLQQAGVVVPSGALVHL